MNLYEWEGKKIFEKYGIATPKSVLVRRGENAGEAYDKLGLKDVVVKAQILSGKRGKNNGIAFCASKAETVKAAEDIFSRSIRGQFVSAVLVEEKLNIAEEHYLSVTYDTTKKLPVLIHSKFGGMDIEDVSDDKIEKELIDFKENKKSSIPFAEELKNCFLNEDARVVEINPLIKTTDGKWVAGDSKIALDEDATFRHKEWEGFEPRTMLGRLPTEREIAVKKIDEGKDYYRGTAGKYIELDGEIAVLFSGGGASIANMDALIKNGLRPSNYTEYSGNPPREKVYQLAKIVLSKPGLKGLWIAGGVANFTDVEETFKGIVDALDELKPSYPIVVRRSGPKEKEGMALMKACGERNNLHMKCFGKEIPMSETAKVLAEMVKSSVLTAAV